MLRIVVVGVGAMGCLFAARLSPFADVTMLGHWPRQLNALQSGLTLIERDGVRETIMVRATAEARTIKSAEIALVLVKSYQTGRAAEEIRDFLAQDGVAITLQNGVGNDDMLASRLGPERVLLGSTTEGATIVDLATVRHGGKGKTILPQASGRRLELIHNFAQLLKRAGFGIELAPDVQAVVWEKLVVNAAINPLTALLDVPNGYLVSNERANSVARDAAREAAMVALALGVAFAPGQAASRAMEVARLTKDNHSSMLQDVRKGRPTELEAITGAIRRHGQAAGIATPVNDALYDLLKMKVSGKDWMAGVDSLSIDLQAMFRTLVWERKHANM